MTALQIEIQEAVHFVVPSYLFNLASQIAQATINNGQELVVPQEK